MGEYSYTSEGDAADDPHLTSTRVLLDPNQPRVTIRRDFLHLPFLGGTILEPHFVQESRYGRMAVFLTRMVAEGRIREARGIGIDRKTALLVEPDGSGRVITGPDHPHGKAILFRLATPREPWKPGQSPIAPVIEAQEFGSRRRIDLVQWGGSGGSAFQLRIEANGLEVTRP